jgi:toxin ParE1/3/4
VRNVSSHPQADAEIDRAAEYLEEHRPDYGALFIGEIRRASREIANDPGRWPLRMFGHRKYLTQKFKYLIWYRETEEGVFITAVHHSSRKPGYWKDRILDEQR